MEGKVTSITKFGAFVALDNGKSGLVHISEIANSFVNDVHDFLQEGQTVKVLVLSTENGKINLSIKKALPQQERPAFRPRTGGAPRAGGASAHTGAQRSAPQSRPAFARPVTPGARSRRCPLRRTSPSRISSSSSSPPRRGRWPI